MECHAWWDVYEMIFELCVQNCKYQSSIHLVHTDNGHTHTRTSFGQQLNVPMGTQYVQSMPSDVISVSILPLLRFAVWRLRSLLITEFNQVWIPLRLSSLLFGSCSFIIYWRINRMLMGWHRSFGQATMCVWVRWDRMTDACSKCSAVCCSISNPFAIN